jgi:hypothetical protein
MSAYAVAVAVSKVVTMITTILMRISLFPDWNRWRKSRSTGDMSVLPSVLIFTNSYAVLFYAYAIDDFIPLFATSVLGVVVGIFMAYYFYRWAAGGGADLRRLLLRMPGHHHLRDRRHLWAHGAVTLFGRHDAGLRNYRHDDGDVRVSNGHDREGHPDQDGDLHAVYDGPCERAQQLLLGRLRRPRTQHVSSCAKHRRGVSERHADGRHVHLQDQGTEKRPANIDVERGAPRRTQCCGRSKRARRR